VKAQLVCWNRIVLFGDEKFNWSGGLTGGVLIVQIMYCINIYGKRGLYYIT
jgi:hypothetical protein